MKKLPLLLAFLVLSITAFAQDALKDELFSMDNIMKYQTEIELTEAQSKAIKKHYNEGNENFNEAKWKLSSQQTKLDELLTESEVKLEETMAQMWEVTKLEQEAKLARLFALIKMKNELSAAQQTKLKELITDKDRKAFFITTDINDEKKVKLQVSGSKRSGTAPLYIIKNKRGDRIVTNAELQDLDPNNIESINVLKGNAAVSLYGKDGKNGVIEIRLKNKN